MHGGHGKSESVMHGGHGKTEGSFVVIFFHYCSARWGALKMAENMGFINTKMGKTICQNFKMTSLSI